MTLVQPDTGAPPVVAGVRRVDDRTEGRARARPLLGHALAYLVLLVALLALTDLHHSWNLDDGAYATQVKVVQETGSWVYPYEHHDVDPMSRFAPVSHGAVTDVGAYPYTKLPAWIEVLRASTAVFGEPIGFYIPSVLAAVLAALVAGALAGRLASGAGPFGFWAVALGPLVVHSQAMWAHSLAAALGGVIALVVVALATGRERAWHLAVVVAAVGALVLVRNEGLLMALAVAVIVATLHLARPGPLVRRVGRAAVWSASVLAVGVVTRLVNGLWSAQLVRGTPVDSGESDAVLTDLGFVSARLHGGARTMFDGIGASAVGTVLALFAVMLGVVGGVLLSRRRGPTGQGWVLVGSAVVVVALRAVMAPSDLGGFLVAVPLVSAGVGVWRWSEASLPERALVGLVSVYVLGVLATQYPEGGSRDWGGRFLFPVLVPATILAVLTLRAVLSRTMSPVRVRLAVPLLLLLCLAPTVAGLYAAGDVRESNRALADLTVEVSATVPTVIRVPHYLTRTSWDGLPDHDWLSANPGTVHEALALLRPGRRAPVAVIGNGAERVHARGYRRDVRSPVLVVFTPA